MDFLILWAVCVAAYLFAAWLAYMDGDSGYDSYLDAMLSFFDYHWNEDDDV